MTPAFSFLLVAFIDTIGNPKFARNIERTRAPKRQPCFRGSFFLFGFFFFFFLPPS